MKEKIKIAIKFFTVSIWFIFDFTIMCCRFSWYLHDEEASDISFSDNPHACDFWWITLNAKLEFQGGDGMVGAAKFSVGLGLIIWIVLGGSVIMLHLSASGSKELKDLGILKKLLHGLPCSLFLSFYLLSKHVFYFLSLQCL